MLEIHTSSIKNTVKFSVDRNSMKEAMDAFDDLDPPFPDSFCILS
ncbi:Uncharacterised protein [Enterobacter cloacae]|uniref:Uncharacterized protein n=1 Tax=Enterobacter cloacae TaxID=550 RepID=A0A0M7JYG8_ENTCL|nr:Uncharacterised protein [Enterobacter cloacae]STQ09471.1 Uncharacterised protein [Enterobacter cloacae]